MDVKAEEGEILCAGTEGILMYNARTSSILEYARQEAVLDGEKLRHIPGLQHRTDSISRHPASLPDKYKPFLPN